jgi:hypothetical protein
MFGSIIGGKAGKRRYILSEQINTTFNGNTDEERPDVGLLDLGRSDEGREEEDSTAIPNHRNREILVRVQRAKVSSGGSEDRKSLFHQALTQTDGSHSERIGLATAADVVPGGRIGPATAMHNRNGTTSTTSTTATTGGRIAQEHGRTWISTTARMLSTGIRLDKNNLAGLPATASGHFLSLLEWTAFIRQVEGNYPLVLDSP